MVERRERRVRWTEEEEGRAGLRRKRVAVRGRRPINTVGCPCRRAPRETWPDHGRSLLFQSPAGVTTRLSLQELGHQGLHGAQATKNREKSQGEIRRAQRVLDDARQALQDANCRLIKVEKALALLDEIEGVPEIEWTLDGF